MTRQRDLDPALGEPPLHPEPVDGPIDPRLLDPRFSIRANLRYLDGSKKIQAIKLVRELTHIGLKDAKDLVESSGWVRRDIPLTEAQQLSESFAEFGSTTEIVPCSVTVIAYDPRHPARGEQPLVRMRVTGPQLAIEHGRLDAWQQPHPTDVRMFSEPEQLHAAVEMQERAWTSAGLELEGDPAVVLERVSAREPSLEREIREAEDPREPALVYADWLSARGDVRGELGPLQQAGATRESEAAIARHATHLFGPLAPHMQQLELGWTAGLITRVGFDVAQEVSGIDSRLELFRTLLALPVLACVRELSVSGIWVGQADPLATVASDVLGGLRVLELSTDGWSTLSVGDWEPLRRLERLRLSGAHLQLGPLRLPRLRTLELGAQTIEERLLPAFADGMLGDLEQLEIRLAYAPAGQNWVDNYTELLHDLLRATPLPRLRSLRVHVQQGTLQERFIATLFDAPFVFGLERLDLVANLSAGARASFDRRRRELPPRAQVTQTLPST